MSHSQPRHGFAPPTQEPDSAFLAPPSPSSMRDGAYREHESALDDSMPPRLHIPTIPRRASLARQSLLVGVPPSNSVAALVYMSLHGDRTVFQLTRDETTIGRKEDNHIVLSCAKISKHHAVVERVVDQDSELDSYGYIYYLRDRNSSNGVKLNDVYISQYATLADGDCIHIGTVALYFHSDVAASGLRSGKDSGNVAGDNQESASTNNEDRSLDAAANSAAQRRSTGTNRRASRPMSSLAQKRISMYRRAPGQQQEQDEQEAEENLRLVTILPSEKKYEDTVSIRQEIDEKPYSDDFPMVDDISDMKMLKKDYEKLRLAYELSKMSYMTDISEHLIKMLDLMFSVMPVDRGVVLLVDKATSLLVTNRVKLREGKGYEKREILLSSTILQRVYNTRKWLITADASEHPDLGNSKSIAKGQIRSVICVPIVAHDQVLGILHLDSRDRINSFLEKDLGLVQTIINQCALSIENSMLFSQFETEIRVTEQLGRFLPPQVVSRMVRKEEVIHKGGREMNGTIVFADIRGFTSLSEKATPQEVFDLLNDYFERLVQVVFHYNGIVDKFIGDEIMAVFGTFEDQHPPPPPLHMLSMRQSESDTQLSNQPVFLSTPSLEGIGPIGGNSNLTRSNTNNGLKTTQGLSEAEQFNALKAPVLNSVLAALEFKKAVQLLNVDRTRAGKAPIAIGVGLNTGRLMSGFMGSNQRLEFTCIGDTVNVASRICGFAERDQVLISEETYRYVRGKIETRFVGSKQFKGKASEIRVYEALRVLDHQEVDNGEVAAFAGSGRFATRGETESDVGSIADYNISATVGGSSSGSATGKVKHSSSRQDLSLRDLTIDENSIPTSHPSQSDQLLQSVSYDIDQPFARRESNASIGRRERDPLRNDRTGRSGPGSGCSINSTGSSFDAVSNDGASPPLRYYPS